MDNNGLQQQIANMRQSFFNERLLNSHFLLLEELEDYDNPNFAENVVRGYFTDNAELLTKVEELLGEKKNFMDFATLDRLVIKFKGSSGAVGAHRVTTKVGVLREYLKAGNIECAKVVLRHVKMDQENLQKKLMTYFQLKKQIPPVETPPPPALPKSENDDNEE